MDFAQRIKIKPSATGVINDLAMQKKHQGERVYNLSAGEPMLSTPEKIVQAAQTAMQAGKTHYSAVSGIKDLKQAAVAWMAECYQANYSSKEVLVTCGGKFAVFAALQSLMNADDEAVIISPYWVSYKPMIEMTGGVVKVLDSKEGDGWDINLSFLKGLLTDKTKVLIINNAANPTGVLYSKDKLRKVLQLATDSGVTVISDEVYGSLVYKGEFVSAGSFVEYKDNVLVVQSCSKSFAMTGWRVGFAFGPEELVDKMTVLQSQSISNTSTISQWAAVKALENASELSLEIRQEMKKRRDVFVSKFKELFEQELLAPASGLYCFVPIDKLKPNFKGNSVEFCADVLENSNVAIVPGEAFGCEGYVRFSFGAEADELVESLEVLNKYLSK